MNKPASIEVIARCLHRDDHILLCHGKRSTLTYRRWPH